MASSYDDGRPGNIDHYHHAVKSEDSTIFPTLKSGDPNERPYTNKDGSGSSHNDIGGGIGSKTNPAHSAMVNWAKNSGVKINNKNL